MSDNEDYWKTVVHPGPLLRLARHRVQVLQDEVFGDAELTSLQIQILKVLYECGDLRKALICDRIKIKTANINSPLKALLERGYVIENVGRDDARKRIVGLTEDGRAEFERMRPLGKVLADRFMEPLRDAERALFFDMLIRVSRVDQEAETEIF